MSESESETLLDGVDPPQDPPPGDPPADPPGEEHAWFWSEGQQGEGKPPEWFKGGKYKSVADQAAAYPELEAKLGSFAGAPEEYDPALPPDLEVPEGVEAGIDKEDPLYQDFVAYAKEKDMTQEAFTGILGLYVKSQAADYASMQTDLATEKEALGPNADARLTELVQKAQNTFDEEMYGAFKSVMTSSADGIKLAEFMFSKMGKAPLPDPGNLNPELSGNMMLELKEMEAEKDADGKLKWLTDPNHRERINQLRQKIYGNAEARTVVG